MKPVLTKWQTDGDLAVLYEVGGLLLFYSKSNDPNFKKGQGISQIDAENTRPYKAIPYSNDNLPSDAFIDLNFAWSA